MQAPNTTMVAEMVKRRKHSVRPFPHRVAVRPTGRTPGEKSAEFESPLEFAPAELEQNPFMAALEMKWRLRQANTRNADSLSAALFLGRQRVRGIERNHVAVSYLFRSEAILEPGWHENRYEFDANGIIRKAPGDHQPLLGLDACKDLKALALAAGGVWNIGVEFARENDRQPEFEL